MSKIYMAIVFVFLGNAAANARQICSEVNDQVGGKITLLPGGEVLFESPTVQYGAEEIPVQGDVGLSIVTSANSRAFCRLSNLELVKAESDNIVTEKSDVLTLDSSGQISGTTAGGFALSRVLCREKR